MQPLVSLDESLHTHLKQGTIGQLSEALDGFHDKVIIFASVM